MKRISGYDTYHLPNQMLLKNGSTIVDQVNYTFNSTTGNLTQRNDVSNSKNETFGYDNLNRLTSITLNSGSANSIAYNPNGNIQSKFDVGTYQYANGNHAVSSITSKASSYNPAVIDITHTSYNRASSVIQQGSVIKKLEFQYGADMQRNRSRYYENSVLQKTVYYLGNYEKEVTSGGTTKEYDYICTPEGLSAIAVKTNGTRSLYMDEDLSWGDRYKQFISRHSWEQPFTQIGFLVANHYNIAGRAEISYFHGATVLQTNKINGTDGVTIGSNIMISEKGQVDYNNMTLLHEYGHYIQQRQWGVISHANVAHSSLLSTAFGWRSTGKHNETWTELDASVRALSYFWDRLENPQRERFKDTHPGKYYDSRLYRNYFAIIPLNWIIHDIIWSR